MAEDDDATTETATVEGSLDDEAGDGARDRNCSGTWRGGANDLVMSLQRALNSIKTGKSSLPSLAPPSLAAAPPSSAAAPPTPAGVVGDELPPVDEVDDDGSGGPAADFPRAVSANGATGAATMTSATGAPPLPVRGGDATVAASPAKAAAAGSGSGIGGGAFCSSSAAAAEQKPSIRDFSMLRVLGRGTFGKVLLVRRPVDDDMVYKGLLSLNN